MPRSWPGLHHPQGRRNGKTQAAVVDWDYNAWGEQIPAYQDDDLVPHRMSRRPLNCPLFQPNIIMEGGSVDFNGRGTILTTESCLLNRNRNPHLSRRQIENRLKAYYGQKHVIWLKGGIVGDDTDGHVDDFARFIAPDKVVIAVEHDPKDENYDVLQENAEILRTARDQDGNPLQVIEIPMPDLVEQKASVCRPPTPTSTSSTAHSSFPTFGDNRARPDRPRNPADPHHRPRSHRHRLPRPHLGPGRHPLPDPAATRLVKGSHF